MRDISAFDNDKELHVSLGDTMKLHLSENPTTGYRWELRSSGGPVLELLEHGFERSSEAVGVGGARRWVFRAAVPGDTRLTVELRRNWEHQAIDTFHIAIKVMPL